MELISYVQVLSHSKIQDGRVSVSFMYVYSKMFTLNVAVMG